MNALARGTHQLDRPTTLVISFNLAARRLGPSRPNSSDDKEIVAHNCVVHRLAADHPVVCVIGALGGGEVDHTECMVCGRHVCRFKLRPIVEKASEPGVSLNSPPRTRTLQ